jgi:hypothetical protein
VRRKKGSRMQAVGDHPAKVLELEKWSPGAEGRNRVEGRGKSCAICLGVVKARTV